ncbi:MAG TPA: sarcosine oxidase subunit delta [Steroidobacteraceae bacterium]|nr:sarcosine oxidase subunit delta [Steroidobacteraceae bacterium]
MKLIPCPLNGLRPVDEFVCGGELRHMPDPAQADDARWSEYVFHRSGVPGVKREWWCHVPSGYWFVLERDTSSDEVLRTWSAQQIAEAGAP